MDRTRIALLGLGRAGRGWLKALRAHPGFQMVAVGDQTLESAQGAADELGIRAYDDYRQLLVEQRPTAAVFALPPFAAEPYLPMAAQGGVAVLTETPFARSFEQAVRAVGCFQDADVPLVVASRWRFDAAVADALATAGGEGLRLAHAVALDDPGGAAGWRGDSQRAGGGVLRDAAYEAVDLLVAMAGLPGDVTAHVGRLGPLVGGRFDTEDTAAILCRCDGGASYAVMAGWRAGPPQSELTLLGAGGHWTLTPALLQHVATTGEMTTIRRPNEAELAAEMLRSFETTVRERPREYVGRAADQLATAAVLEAAYHSARTHAPESPMEAYELAGLPMPRIRVTPRAGPIAMLIGILSDSHGDAEATAKAVAMLESSGAEALFHCGDICGERVLDELAGRRAYFVWGNCDEPSAALRKYVDALGLTWLRPPIRVTLAGKRIGLYHGHERGFQDALADPTLDYVFFGHTHKVADDRDGGPRAINPGALFRAAVKTVALLDLSDDRLTFLTLDGREYR